MQEREKYAASGENPFSSIDMREASPTWSDKDLTVIATFSGSEEPEKKKKVKPVSGFGLPPEERRPNKQQFRVRDESVYYD